MKSNIVLTGMPGAGKSTLGVVLAKNLGYGFIDSDLVIQEKTGKRLCELIEELGDEGFLKLEDSINQRIEAQRAVIATGGSAVYGAQAMAHFKETGTIVYLEVPYDEIEKRLGDLEERGVVLAGCKTVRDLFEQRRALYRKYADIVIEEWREPIPAVVKRIKNRLKTDWELQVD